MGQENFRLFRNEGQIREDWEQSGIVPTIDDLRAFISRQRWQESTTMKKFAPHEYILKWNLTERDQQIFEELVLFIRDEGYLTYFGKRSNMYFVVDGRQYWTMGDPLETTWVLNRCDLSLYKTVFRGWQAIEEERNRNSQLSFFK